MSYIETPRLLLRTWIVPGDVDDAAEIFTDSEVLRYAQDRLVAREAVPALLERFLHAEERDGFSLWPVVLKATREVVGDCGLGFIEGTRDVEISWHFKRSAWGHGYASEAAAAVLDFAFSQAGLTRVYALIDPANERSVAVANRLGMRFDRVVRAYKRDVLRYEKTKAAYDLAAQG